MAIVTAARYADLVGITTVAGNAPLERTTYNARVMRDLLGLDVPIHSGSPRPLLAPPRFGAFVHGESGLDGADLPAPTTPLDGTDAVAFIVETSPTVDDVWIIPVAPLAQSMYECLKARMAESGSPSARMRERGAAPTTRFFSSTMVTISSWIGIGMSNRRPVKYFGGHLLSCRF